MATLKRCTSVCFNRRLSSLVAPKGGIYCLNQSHLIQPQYYQLSLRKAQTTSSSKIDELLLAKQEDPTVVKQKEELLRAFATQLQTKLRELQHDPRIKLKYLLKKVYGCTSIEIKTYCSLFGIHEQTPLPDVPPLFYAVLILHLNRIPRFGAENLLIEAQSIRMIIENKTWKGLRHVQAMPVHTRRSRKQKTQKKLGRKRAQRLGFPCTRTQ